MVVLLIINNSISKKNPTLSGGIIKNENYLNQHGNRVFNVFFQCLKKCCSNSSINCSVIATHCHFHHIGYAKTFSITYYNFLDPANCKYAAIRWIDDGGKFFNVHHSKVRNSECVAAEFLWL